MASVSGCEYSAAGADGPAQNISHETCCHKSSFGAVAHDAALPGYSAITRLHDRRPRADQPNMRAVEDATQQQMSGRQRPRRPMRAAVVGGQNHTAFSKDQSALGAVKNRVRQTCVYVEPFNIHSLPTHPTVSCLEQVCALLIRLQSQQITLAQEPSGLFIGKINVAQYVRGQRMKFAPCL